MSFSPQSLFISDRKQKYMWILRKLHNKWYNIDIKETGTHKYAQEIHIYIFISAAELHVLVKKFST